MLPHLAKWAIILTVFQMAFADQDSENIIITNSSSSTASAATSSTDIVLVLTIVAIILLVVLIGLIIWVVKLLIEKPQDGNKANKMSETSISRTRPSRLSDYSYSSTCGTSSACDVSRTGHSVSGSRTRANEHSASATKGGRRDKDVKVERSFSVSKSVFDRSESNSDKQ